ncbi:MAG: HPF/RaiA family ribosome-associated protein [Burkholderiales bacterium]
MQVHFESRTPDGALVQHSATRRARFVMRRLSWLVPRVRIVLSDVNGARGGIDKRCQVETQAVTGNTVVVVAMATNWHAAVDLALKRVSRTLLRSWRRMQQRDRPVLRALHGH